jgi:catechol 2,3-dioxygenase-like lactoylglutathione lyase family enzyme
MEHIIANLLQDFEQGRMNRRQLIQSLALAATAASAASAAPPADSKVLKAVYINHVSYQVADYAKTRDFYAGLFGMKVSADDGKQCRLSVGESIIVARTRPSGTPHVDHIAYTIADWDKNKKVKDEVIAELKNRGLEIRAGDGSPLKDLASAKSLHIQDPDGFMVQMGGKDQ